MESNRAYLTISEFAEKTKLSKQYIYARFDKELKPYSAYIDGLKMIHISALELFGYNIPIEQETAQEIPENRAEGIPADPNAQNIQREYINYLVSRIDELERENAKQRETIDNYSNRIMELTERAQDLTDKALTTLSQQQYLQLDIQTKKKKDNIFRRLLGHRKQIDD